MQANSIPYVVHVSSGGGGVINAGPVSGLHDVEGALDAVATNILHLRCGNFMENFLTQLQAIQDQGCFYYPAPGDYPIPMVATQDIASVAAKYLRDRSWVGHNVLAVHGAADLSFDEAAKIMSDVLGKTIRYVSLPPEQFRQVLLSHGASADGAEQFLLMFHAFTQQNAYAAEPRTPQTTTATTLAQWVKTMLILRPSVQTRHMSALPKQS
ncbi:NmrA family NAD(P)-binding protein [Iningainema tapete]|uniref:NmrA family NAD(P)-binding protein n=1 Tax=Iningainema tapete BLCC-T55 TaxID=2748662 RepID=A0A8J6XL98_9CYAN|nr:NmrA family NAD(P)-binding protein [Iningainema tapete BLCC-T55]